MNRGKGNPSTLGPVSEQVTVAVKVPKAVGDAIRAAAAANFETMPSYLRRVVVERLRADGVLSKVEVKS